MEGNRQRSLLEDMKLVAENEHLLPAELREKAVVNGDKMAVENRERIRIPTSEVIGKERQRTKRRIKVDGTIGEEGGMEID